MKWFLILLASASLSFAELIPPLPPEIRQEIEVSPVPVLVSETEVITNPAPRYVTAWEVIAEPFILPEFNLMANIALFNSGISTWRVLGSGMSINTNEILLDIETPANLSYGSPIGIAVRGKDVEKARELLKKYRLRGK